MADDKYTKRLDKIERDIEWIIQYLLKKDHPLQIPPYNPSTICPKCGMNWDGIMGYVCMNQPCPIQPSSTLSVSSVSRNDDEWYTGRAGRDNMSNPGDKSYDD